MREGCPSTRPDPWANINLSELDSTHPWLSFLVSGLNDPSFQVIMVSSSTTVAILIPTSLSIGGSKPMILW